MNKGTDTHASNAANVREKYDVFDARRDRTMPTLDAGDAQSVHAWMRAVTEWVEATDARLDEVAAKAHQGAYAAMFGRPK